MVSGSLAEVGLEIPRFLRFIADVEVGDDGEVDVAVVERRGLPVDQPDLTAVEQDVLRP
jgi:hypothetical protein